MLKALLETTSSLVFPVECEICGNILLPSQATGICEKCASDIRLIAPPHCSTCGRNIDTILAGGCGECFGESFYFDRAYACTFYDGKMKELLHAYKFGNRKILKNFFVGIIIRFIELNLDPDRFDVFAAVPLDREKKDTRGFNQSEILCSPVAKKFGKPDHSAKLSRRKSLFTQSLLKKSERKLNVRNCFSVKTPGIFASKNVLIIDDILTTGQTTSECARILKEAGAGSVTVLALARGL